MKGIIINRDYQTIDDKAYIQLFGRLENGDSFVSLNEFKPYLFVEESNLKKIKSLISKYKTEKTKLKNFKGKSVSKIICSIHPELSKLRSAIHKKEVSTYEADLKPSTKYMIDKDLFISLEIEGDWETSERVDRVYNNPSIKPISLDKTNAEPKIVSIDIESGKENNKLFCVGIYSKNYQKNFLISNKKIKNAVSCKNESELLEKFKEEFIKIDPDIIIGWHVIDFDFAYLRKKFLEHKIQFDLGRTNENSRIKIENNFFRSSSAKISGRQVLDGLNLIRDPFIKEAPSIKSKKFKSYALEDVAQSLLGEGKILKGKSRHDEITELFKNNQEKLVEYNLQDCKLAYDILEKTKTLDLAIERASLTGMPLNKISASIASFDSLYIREARKKNLVSPTTFYEKRGERIKGGYVMESEPGIFHNVLVLDFKSLYPSIIKTFNIDPASHLEKKGKNSIESPNKTYFKNQEGILPEIIETLHQAREKAKKEKRELSSYAIKIIMNSFFGVLASPNCRYFSLKMANAITHFGQFLIQLTAKKIEELGHKVIYSDTDSVFIETNLEKSEATKLGRELQDYINDFYKKYIKENYKRKSYLELEFEKLYLAFLMPPARSSKVGSKKRYAGLIEENGKEKIEIVGLEAIRGDWTEAAQNFQKKLLDKIFHKEEFLQFIRNYVKKIKDGKMDKELIYRKSLTKPLKEYIKTTPPHVKAARKLDKVESKIIEYYQTKEGPEPLQKLKNKIDYEHYIKKQIAPIANTILYFFDKDFEDIMKKSKQTKLFD